MFFSTKTCSIIKWLSMHRISYYYFKRGSKDLELLFIQLMWWFFFVYSNKQPVVSTWYYCEKNCLCKIKFLNVRKIQNPKQYLTIDEFFDRHMSIFHFLFSLNIPYYANISYYIIFWYYFAFRCKRVNKIFVSVSSIEKMYFILFFFRKNLIHFYSLKHCMILQYKIWINK